jgi:acetyltransferase-like isoleucine patch superfamily enzyme
MKMLKDRVIGYLAWKSWFSNLKIGFHRMAGIQIGNDVFMGKGTLIWSSKQRESCRIGNHTHIECDVIARGDTYLHVGNGCYIGARSYIDLAAPVIIADRVAIGNNLTIMTHDMSAKWRGLGEMVRAPVHIKEGAWIGINVTILAGSTIGEGCIIGAGTMVKGELEPYGLYVGTPAKRVKDLPKGETHRRELAFEGTKG